MAVAELTRAHLVVEFVLCGAEVTQVFGYLRPFCNKGVLLLVATALYDELSFLQRKVHKKNAGK